MPTHSNNTKTFEELSYAEQASSISAQILSLEKAIVAHERRALSENRDITELNSKTIAQIQRMIDRIRHN